MNHGRYEYTECGLSGFFLEGGFTVRSTPYGESVAIHNLQGLHDAIGHYLANCPKDLTGAEFRFLRKELNLSQKSLGKLFNISDQTVANWEKGIHELPSAMDRTVRLLFLEKIGDRNKNLTALLEHLADLDQLKCDKVTLKGDASGWQVVQNHAA